MAARVRASGRPEECTRVTVELDLADAIAVGQNLRSLSRAHSTPFGAREAFARVGDKLTAAGLAQLQLQNEAVPK